MPSTATITAFYSFTANTKARASQVNANFDLYRGHLVAIDPNTQTAVSNTYDIGSTEYRWRSGYFNGIDITSNTTTGQALRMTGDTSGSKAAFVFNVNGTEVGRIAQRNQTLTATKGGLASSAVINYSSAATTVAFHIPGSTCTLSTIGRPVMVSFLPAGGETLTSIQLFNFTHTAQLIAGNGHVYIARDGTIIATQSLRFSFGVTTAAYNVGDASSIHFPLNFTFVDTPAAGSYNYSLLMKGESPSGTSLAIYNGKLLALEL